VGSKKEPLFANVGEAPTILESDIAPREKVGWASVHQPAGKGQKPELSRKVEL
jgi:hypothetical protein